MCAKNGGATYTPSGKIGNQLKWAVDPPCGATVGYGVCVWLNAAQGTFTAAKLINMTSVIRAVIRVSDGVTKQIINHGKGRKVKKGDFVTVHCEGSLAETNRTFWR